MTLSLGELWDGFCSLWVRSRTLLTHLSTAPCPSLFLLHAPFSSYCYTSVCGWVGVNQREVCLVDRLAASVGENADRLLKSSNLRLPFHGAKLYVYIYWNILPSKTTTVWEHVCRCHMLQVLKRFHSQSITFTTLAFINLSPFITLFLFPLSHVFMAVWEDTLNQRAAECEMLWLIINHSFYWLTGKIGQSKKKAGASLWFLKWSQRQRCIV